MAHVEGSHSALLRSIDETGVLDDADEDALLASVAEVLPRAGGQAFFVNWSAPHHAYDTSKATPVATSRAREGAISEILRSGTGPTPPRRSLTPSPAAQAELLAFAWARQRRATGDVRNAAARRAPGATSGGARRWARRPYPQSRPPIL